MTSGFRLVRILLLLSGVVGLCSEATAHEAGTTRVSVEFDEDRSYRIDIVTDASVLAEKLEASAGRQLPSDAHAPLFERVLRSSDDVFRRRFAIRFDDVAVRPEAAYRVDPPADAMSVAVATISLSGQTPLRAQRFTWSYGWTFTSYELTLRDRGEEAQTTQLLEGDQASAPFTLKPPPTQMERLRTTMRNAVRYASAGWTAVLLNGVDHVLFALGVYFLTRRATSALWQVGAFIVSGFLAGVLSTSGLVSVSPRLFAPLIGLSIVYIAIENLALTENVSRRVSLIFFFGFLHGVGCAASFNAAGVPHVGMTAAVLSFNLSAQAGVVSTIAAAFLIVGWHCASEEWYRNRIVLPASTLLACTAVYWTIVHLSF